MIGGMIMNKNSKYQNKNNRSSFLFILLLLVLFILPTIIKLNNNTGNDSLNNVVYENNVSSQQNENIISITQSKLDLNSIPNYSGNPYVAINNNVPYFVESELTTKSYESYGELDSLGRCTSAIACVGKDLMPTQKRESISKVKPTRMA